MMDYRELLKRAYEHVPKISFDKSRFQLPEPDVIQIGNRTILKNFRSICSTMRRDEKHVMKYLLRELGAAGNIEGEMLVVQGKFGLPSFKSKINTYLEEYVFCRECHRPDTRLVKQEDIMVMMCEACGARRTVRSI